MGNILIFYHHETQKSSWVKHAEPLKLLRHFAVSLSVPAVLKLLKMAVGMRALLDTVMQALPQVQCDSVQSPWSARSPLPFLKLASKMCFLFTLLFSSVFLFTQLFSISLFGTREESGRCSWQFWFAGMDSGCIQGFALVEKHGGVCI